jgi:2-polyprenyl-3-methyl-5-hydroxy-6-metoxy-1,4-benzoquinol methylase
LKTSATLNEFPFFKRKSLPCWLLKKNVNLNSRILDVGCGAGKLLTQLYYLGFKNLTGVDPYISQNYNYGNKVKIWKKELYELNEEFDFIMLHHCFEHLQNPKDSFDYLAKIIASTGTILIRIPIISSFAWQIYKTHWIQLDPPRHFFLHSIKSIELLAMNAGLKVESIDYDSTGFQFWGSELYKRDIAYEESKNMVVFSGEEITKYNNYANILNNRHEGDQACFYLKKC